MTSISSRGGFSCPVFSWMAANSLSCESWSKHKNHTLWPSSLPSVSYVSTMPSVPLSGALPDSLPPSPPFAPAPPPSDPPAVFS